MPQEKADTSGGFDPEIPSTPDVSRPALKAHRLDGKLDEGTLSPALHRLLLDIARVRNIVSSLRLEGIEVDLEGARRVLRSRETMDRGEREVLRFGRKYREIHETEISDLPDLSIDLITSWHEELLKDADEIVDDAHGRLKEEPNAIYDRTTGEPRFIPTPPGRTEEELESLFSWFRRVKGSGIPGPIAAIFFAEFQAIHPFRDGNGRIGRILNALVLKKLGHENVALIPLDGRFYRTEQKYYEAIASTNDGQTWFVWSRYFTDQLQKAYEIATRRADLDPVLEAQGSQVARDLLEWVLQGAGDWFQRGDYPNPEGYNPQSLTRALGSLTEQGILEPRGEKRGREYKLSTDFLETVYEGIESW